MPDPPSARKLVFVLTIGKAIRGKVEVCPKCNALLKQVNVLKHDTACGFVWI